LEGHHEHALNRPAAAPPSREDLTDTVYIEHLTSPLYLEKHEDVDRRGVYWM
jgi:hypothetical protein